MDTKILIVEDDVISGSLLNSIIINLGYTSLGVVPAAEYSLYKVMNDHPDLVLMDIGLSGVLDGIQTAEIITKQYHIPVIFVTASGDQITMERATKIGAAYLVKPFSEESISRVLQTVLSNLTPLVAIEEQLDYKNKRIPIKQKDEIVFINLYDVIYFEAMGHIVQLQTKESALRFRSSLKNLQRMDSEGRFNRVHKSFMVQTRFIDGLIMDRNYYYHIRLKNNPTLIPVSKNKTSFLKKQLKEL